MISDHHVIRLLASASLLLPRELQDFFATFTPLAHLYFVFSKTYIGHLREDVAPY